MNVILDQPALSLGERPSLEATDSPPGSGQSIDEPASLIRRGFGWIGRTISGLFEITSLVILLAIVAAAPILQFIALGYLLAVAGKIANGSTVSAALVGRQQAATVGRALLAILLVGLPCQALTNWENVAGILQPNSPTATWLRIGSFVASMVALMYLAWAWIRGGRLVHYLWPQPIRFATEFWRPSTWSPAADRLWNLIASLELHRYFWLGARAAVGTLVWLIPAMIVIAVNRNGQTGLAGLVGAIAIVSLIVVMQYLPMLQVNFASRSQWKALFRVSQARSDFRHAPWSYTSAMLFGLIIAPVPLYLLKIEATPKEVVWMPCLFFVAFMLPARVVQGLALRRARSKTSLPIGKMAAMSRWICRVGVLTIAFLYVGFVYLSQYISWNGLETWVQQHAILVPFPFLGV